MRVEYLPFYAAEINAFEVLAILILTAYTTYTYKIQCTVCPMQLW